MSNKYKELIDEYKKAKRTEKSMLNKICLSIIIGFLAPRANRIVRVVGEIMIDAGAFIITNMLIVRCGAALGLFVNLIITVLWSAMTIELEELVQLNAIIQIGIYLFAAFTAGSTSDFLIRYSAVCIIYLLLKELISYMIQKSFEEMDRPLLSDTKSQHPTESE